MKAKLTATLLLVVCFTLAGALYATAAPSTNADLSKRVAALEHRVKVLEKARATTVPRMARRVEGLELAISSTQNTTSCELLHLWAYAEALRIAYDKPWLAPDAASYRLACP